MLTQDGSLPSVPRVVPRVAVLASGGGTNLQALLDDPVVGPWVVLVLSDRADARALERAAAVACAPNTSTPPRSPIVLRTTMRSPTCSATTRSTWSSLAGFMRIVGPELVEAFDGRMLNVHPALLPAFPGAHAVADALAWNVKVTGVTVHLVDHEVDHGPIVSQEPVAVSPDDDWDSLEARIHEVEHRLLPAAVRALGEGRLAVDGRGVRVLEDGPDRPVSERVARSGARCSPSTTSPGSPSSRAGCPSWASELVSSGGTAAALRERVSRSRRSRR